MALGKGELVPDFAAILDSGQEVRLAELIESGPLVIFFYPKAFTPGCTAQSCRFRDLSRELGRLGARAVGVSSDDVETQRSFAESNRLGFPLISDQDGKIAKIFGAKRLGVPFDRRMTFVIGKDRRVILVIKDEFNMNAHADKALEALAEIRDVEIPDLEADSF